MKLKKIISILAVASMVAMPVTTLVSSAESMTENTISPRTPVSWEKSVTKTYSSLSVIPDSIYYEEYSYGAWISGWLDLDGVVKSGSTYKATFKGKIFGNI